MRQTMRPEIESLRCQLNSMCAANVPLMLKDKKNKKQVEGLRCAKDEKIGMLKDKVWGITRDHVKYILSNAQLAVLSGEQTSKNEKDLGEEKFVIFDSIKIGIVLNKLL